MTLQSIWECRYKQKIMLGVTLKKPLKSLEFVNVISEIHPHSIHREITVSHPDVVPLNRYGQPYIELNVFETRLVKRPKTTLEPIWIL